MGFLRGVRSALFIVLLVFVALLDAHAQPQPCPVDAAPGQLIINEILFHAEDPALEFVELQNRSSCNARLDALSLADEREAWVRLVGAPVVPPGGFVVLTSSRTAFVAAFGAIEVVEVPRWPTLNNGGDAVRIARGTETIDSIRFHANWGIPGRSIERRDPDVLAPVAVNWAVSVDDAGATPGRVNSVYSPDREAPTLTYAEQESPRLIYAETSEPLHPAADLLASFRMDGVSPVSVERDGEAAHWLRFDRDVEAPTLGGIGLRDAAGNVAAEHTVAVARPPRPGDLLISELMFDPRIVATASRPTQPEYVEVYNATVDHIALRGVALSDDEDGRASLAITNRRIAVSPGRYVVVYEGGGVEVAGAAVPPELSAFPDPTDAVRWLPVRSVSPRGLANNGQPLALTGRDGVLIDFVSYVSNWHSLTLRELGETRGVALERRSMRISTNDPTNWDSSIALPGGTPGRPNSVGLSAGTGEEGEARKRLHVTPSPFSPNDDGFEDVVWITYRLRHQVAAVRIRVFDLDGRAVRSIEAPYLSGTTGSALWNGRDDHGRTLPIGIYIVLLESLTAETAATERYRSLVTIAR